MHKHSEKKFKGSPQDHINNSSLRALRVCCFEATTEDLPCFCPSISVCNIQICGYIWQLGHDTWEIIGDLLGLRTCGGNSWPAYAWVRVGFLDNRILALASSMVQSIFRFLLLTSRVWLLSVAYVERQDLEYCLELMPVLKTRVWFCPGALSAQWRDRVVSYSSCTDEDLNMHRQIWLQISDNSKASVCS